VDIYEAAQKELIWRGTGNDTVHANPEEIENQIRESTSKMFAKFPPSAQ
jgi:hypothetical protein